MLTLEKRSQIYNLGSQFKKLEKREQKQPKSHRRVEITESRHQRKLKHTGNIRKSVKPKAASLKTSVKLIKLLARLTKEKKKNRKLPILGIKGDYNYSCHRYQKDNITPNNSMHIKSMAQMKQTNSSKPSITKTNQR